MRGRETVRDRMGELRSLEQISEFRAGGLGLGGQGLFFRLPRVLKLIFQACSSGSGLILQAQGFRARGSGLYFSGSGTLKPLGG